MKITFIIYSLGPGGAERAVTGLANYWAPKHDVQIITMVKTIPFYHLDPRVRLDYCLEHQKKNSKLLDTILDTGRRLLQLEHLLRVSRPNVVVSFIMKTNIYALWVTKWLKIPCVISERANHERNRQPKIQEIIRDFSYRNISKLVVQTQGNKAYYQKNIAENKIEVIPNGIPETLEQTPQVVATTTEKIILNVGAFRNGKAQDLLIRAFAKLQNPDWRLVFLGDGSNLEKFKSLTDSLGVAHRVTFEGAQKNIETYYQKASVFVFTSEHEGFPNALLEALHFGLACISTNCPHGPADMINHGVNGFLTPVGDETSLLEKMELLVNDDALRNTFSQNALESSKQYQLHTIAQRWMEVLKAVV